MLRHLSGVSQYQLFRIKNSLRATRSTSRMGQPIYLPQGLIKPQHGCRHCDIAFEDEKALRSYLENSPQHNHYCTDCREDFPSLEALKKHLLNWQSPDHQTTYCERCDLKIPTWDAKLDHTKTNPTKQFLCRICEWDLATPDDLAEHNHIKSHDSNEDGETYCARCDQDFLNQNDLREV